MIYSRYAINQVDIHGATHTRTRPLARILCAAINKKSGQKFTIETTQKSKKKSGNIPAEEKCREIYAKIEWNWWQDPLQPHYLDDRRLIPQGCWGGDREEENATLKIYEWHELLGPRSTTTTRTRSSALIGWDWSVPHVSANIARTNLNQWTRQQRKGISFGFSFFGGTRTSRTGNYELINNFWVIFHRAQILCVWERIDTIAIISILSSLAGLVYIWRSSFGNR